MSPKMSGHRSKGGRVSGYGYSAQSLAHRIADIVYTNTDSILVFVNEEFVTRSHKDTFLRK